MISFLIVNYFTSEYVLKLLGSINKYLNELEYEILIFDNSDNEVEYNKLLGVEGIRRYVYKGKQNLGFVAANNCLYKKAVGDFVVLINPDTLIIDASLVSIFNYMNSNNSIAIAGPQLLNDDYSYQVSFFKFPRLLTLLKEHIFLVKKHPYAYKTSNSKSRVCDVVKGACLIINRKLWTEENLFDEELVMYSEELELCKRVQLKGFKVYYFADAKIIHFGEKSSTADSASEYSLYHYYRSKLIYFRKYSIKSYYKLVRLILLFSLFEKSTVLYLFGHFRNARLHSKVFKKILNESKIINNL